jgi:2-amino-4-hydroxy-6-hydroxymethyldihydropteridine diphosphokinase
LELISQNRPVHAFIGLGSNLGDGRANLQRAWQRLDRQPHVRCRQLSSPYLTSPLAMESRRWFTNGVGEVETDLDPASLLAVLHTVEKEMGRDRAASRDRIIDLDLLFYHQLIQDLSGCRVPHPEIERRLFVLVPLAEIAPFFRHPETGRTAREMLAGLAASDQKITKAAWCPATTEKFSPECKA